ncbi:MAG: hypothetical protein CSB55_04635 [Candidatus Cloacimonadota bacterium]|nr:MAG: hypothetical protein CSB55_04635 [Candidatus Cloacimonadota bacterium]
MKKTEISFIIPVQNEENTLKQTAEEFFLSAENFGYKADIIFIDNGSCDNSLKILFDLRSQYDDIKIISRKNPGNYTDLIASALPKASGDYVVATGNCLKKYPQKIKKIIDQIKNYPVDLVLIRSIPANKGIARISDKIILAASNFLTRCCLPFAISPSFLTGKELNIKLIKTLNHPGNIIDKALLYAQKKVYIDFDASPENKKLKPQISSLNMFLNRLFTYPKIRKKHIVKLRLHGL